MDKLQKCLKLYWLRYSPLIGLIALIVLTVGCVTVTLSGGKKRTTAEGIIFTAPTSFRAIKVESADHAWQNRQNGNSISVHSSCGDETDLSLKQLLLLSVSDLEDVVVVDQKDLTFNNREALRSHLSGRVDGVPTEIETLVFKKNRCTFNLTYVGVKKYFSSGIHVFEEFLTSFKAP